MNKKVLRFDWKYGTEEVVLSIFSYDFNNSLYIGLMNKTEGTDGNTEEDYDDFCDVTVNLRESDVKINEAYISGDFTKDLLRFIDKYNLGKILPEYGYSGFCRYHKVAFDLEKLREYDPEEVAEYLESRR